MLERCGFSVVRAVDGKSAIEVFQREPTAYRLILLDLLMPVMDGAETFQEVHRINPEVPVILMSGYSENTLTERFRGKSIAGFIQKPFETQKLTEILRKALGA